MSAVSNHRNRVIIIYNADGSIPGKLRYAYKKLFGGQANEDAQQPAKPVCGNCDITHGGLSLTETTAWRSSKERLMSSLNVDIAQLHRDELNGKVREYVKENSIQLPTVLLDDGSKVKEIVSRDEVNVCVRGEKGKPGSIEEQRAELMISAIEKALRSEESESKL